MGVLATTQSPCPGSRSTRRRGEGRLSWAKDRERSRPSGDTRLEDEEDEEEEDVSFLESGSLLKVPQQSWVTITLKSN